jgi:hypothetical protein
MEYSTLISINELAECVVSPQMIATEGITEKHVEDSSMTSASSAQPHMRRKTSLLIQWPPPRPNSFRPNDSSTLMSCVDQAISTVRSTSGDDDLSRHTYHGPSSSSLHTRRDCPVTPGSVQNRLSAIMSAFSPTPNLHGHQWSEGEDSPSNDSFAGTSGQSLTSSPGLPLPPVYSVIDSPRKKSVLESPKKRVKGWSSTTRRRSSLSSVPSSTDHDGEMNRIFTGFSGGHTATTSCTPSDGTRVRTYLKRRNSSKLKKTWPPTTKKRDDGERAEDPEERRSRIAAELQCITRSGFQERRSRFESVTKVPASTGDGTERDMQVHPSRSGSTFSGITDPTTILTDDDDTMDCMESPVPTDGVWVVEQGFAGGESYSNFCYDEWATEAEFQDANKVSPPIDEEYPYEGGLITLDTMQSNDGEKPNRRTSYRIGYDGPIMLRLEDVYGNLMMIPEADGRFELNHEKDVPPAPPSRPDLSARLPHRHREKDKNSLSLCNEKSGSDGVDDDEDARCETRSRRDRKRGKRRPNVWITPLKSRSGGSRKWKVKRVWDIETIDEEEPEYEIDQEDLMYSIKDLLGVPNMSEATLSKLQNELGSTNRWNTTDSNNSAPNKPVQRPFSVTTFFDVDGELDGSEATISLDVGQFVQEMKNITESADYDNVIEEVEYDYNDEGGLSNIGFQRPLSWVCPEQTSQKSYGPKSWKSKNIQATNTDGLLESNREESLDSSMILNDPRSDASRLTETPSETSESELPRHSRSPLSLYSSYRSPLKSRKVRVEILPKGLPKVEDGEKLARGIPTWQKAAVSKTQEKDHVKLWWEE